jgi:3-methyladenine DNA glycosylase AlkD
MGTTRPILAVRASDMHALARKLARLPDIHPDRSGKLLDGLYAGETFEHRVVAGLTLHNMPGFRRNLDLQQLRSWIGDLRGWCEIDSTCQNGWSARELLARWDEWQPFLDGCAADSTIGLRRASLALLLQPVRESDDHRLLQQALSTVDSLKHEKDPLITKSISWLLRALTKQHPDAVRAYLDANEATLPAIAVRETRKKLDTGKKK